MFDNHKTGPKIVEEILKIGHKGKGRNFTFGHVGTAHEMIFVDYGGVDLTIEDAAFQLRAGDCAFISAGRRHSFHGIAAAPFNFLNVNYSGRLPAELADRSVKVSEDGVSILNRLKRVMTEPLNEVSAELAACLVTEFILLSCWERSLSLRPEPLTPSNRRRYRSEVVNQALTLIADKYADELKADFVSASVGISASHLRLLLKRETGHGFQAHLHMARAEAAKRLLMERSDNVGMIAEKVGYKTPPFFYKVFRRVTGMTPLEYAKSLGAPQEVTPNR